MRQPIVKDWTDYEITRLKLLWSQGYAASYIGADIGRSRSSIIGKAHRLKLDADQHAAGAKELHSVQRERSARIRRMKRQQVKIPRQIKRSVITMAMAPVRVVEAPDLRFLRSQAWEPLPGTSPKPLEAIGAHDCRWPLHDGPFLFCAEPIKGVGHVYCATHTAMSEARK